MHIKQIAKPQENRGRPATYNWGDILSLSPEKWHSVSGFDCLPISFANQLRTECHRRDRSVQTHTELSTNSVYFKLGK